jgi:hypothetical protein
LKARVAAGMLVDLWDRALGAPPVERAVDALVIGLDLDPADVDALAIGRRDELLLRLRVDLFGDHFDAVTKCPSCNELVEATFDAGDLRTDEPDIPKPFLFTHSSKGRCEEKGFKSTEAGDWRVEWRLPTSADLRAIAGSSDADTARAALVARCVLDARCEGEPRDAVPESVLARVTEDMGRSDPGAEIRFELACPWCEHSWSALFDIAEFFWAEVDAATQRLLEDVGTLAAAYGWSERDILAMGPVRRDRYLELAP